MSILGKKALNCLIRTINATGGVYIDRDGNVCPVGDPEWIDLGEAYSLGCYAMGYEMTVQDIHVSTIAEENRKGGE